MEETLLAEAIPGPTAYEAVVRLATEFNQWWLKPKGNLHLNIQSALLGRKPVPYASNQLKNKVADVLVGKLVNKWRKKRYNRAPQYYLPQVVEQLRGKFALRERTPAVKDEVRRSILLLIKDHNVDSSWLNEVMSGTIYMLLRPADSEMVATKFAHSSSHAERMKHLTGEAYGAGRVNVGAAKKH